MEHGKPWVNYNETPSPIAKRGLHLRKIMTFVWWYVNVLQAAITESFDHEKILLSTPVKAIY
jgi:hypothetical protein